MSQFQWRTGSHSPLNGKSDASKRQGFIDAQQLLKLAQELYSKSDYGNYLEHVAAESRGDL